MVGVVARRTDRAPRRKSARGALGVGLAVAAFASTRPARADVDLRWDAPPSCPQREEVLARVRALAGSALEQTLGLSVQGTITRSRGRYWLTLLVRDGRDERKRVIASKSCVDLTGAAAIAVALLLGVDAAELDRAAGPSPSATKEGKPSAAEAASPGAKADRRPPEAPAPRQAPASPEERESPASSAGSERSDSAPGSIVLWAPIGTADVGPLRRPAFGVGLGAGLRYESWRFLVLGRIARSQTVLGADENGAFGAELGRMTGEVVACRGWRSLRFEIAPCVAFAVEHLNARGFGDGVSGRSERTTWPALGAGGAAHWYALESLAFFLSMTGYVELARPSVVMDGVGQLSKLGPAALGAMFGAEWIF